MVQAQNYGSYYAEHQECPPFHVFLINLGASALEKFGDPEWVIAVFTVVLAFATYFLWRATRQLVVGAEKTAERQLRAYLMVDTVTIGVANNCVEVVVQVKNAGQTPAYDFTAALSITVTDTPADVDFTPHAELLSRGTLGPAGIRHPRDRMTLEPPHFEALQNEKMILFVFGRLEYKDIFDEPRFVDFRYRAIKTGKGWLAQAEQQGNDSN